MQGKPKSWDALSALVRTLLACASQLPISWQIRDRKGWFCLTAQRFWPIVLECDTCVGWSRATDLWAPRKQREKERSGCLYSLGGAPLEGAQLLKAPPLSASTTCCWPSPHVAFGGFLSPNLNTLCLVCLFLPGAMYSSLTCYCGNFTFALWTLKWRFPTQTEVHLKTSLSQREYFTYAATSSWPQRNISGIQSSISWASCYSWAQLRFYWPLFRSLLVTNTTC